MPGPGSYSPIHVGDKRASSWTMGDRNSRRSAVAATESSPGPVYQMRSSVEKQMISNKTSSPSFGFGTQRRLAEKSSDISPGPGAYSPRVTCSAAPSSMLSDRSVDATLHSVQLANGTWSRSTNRRAFALPTIPPSHPPAPTRSHPTTTDSLGPAPRSSRSLADVRDGPGPTKYSPTIGFTKVREPAYTMRLLGARGGIGGGGEDSPGPSAYNPSVKSRFGGGFIGDAPAFSIADKDENIKRFISTTHSRIYQGLHSPAPSAYSPLEDLGITSYTVSNTSRHAPMYSFGSEARDLGK